MIAEKINDNKEFKPIAVKIVIESKQELILLKQIFGLNVSIPKALTECYGDAGNSYDLLGTLKGLFQNL